MLRQLRGPPSHGYAVLPADQEAPPPFPSLEGRVGAAPLSPPHGQRPRSPAYVGRQLAMLYRGRPPHNRRQEPTRPA